MQVQLHNIADPITLAAATGNQAVVAQVMAYEMIRQTKEYPPADIAEMNYLASMFGEAMQKLCPVTMVEMDPDYAEEEAAVEEEGDEEAGFD